MRLIGISVPSLHREFTFEYLYVCTHFFCYAAFGTNVLIILHMCWGVLMFSGLNMCYDRTNMIEGIFKIVLTITTHLGFSLLVSFVYFRLGNVSGEAPPICVYKCFRLLLGFGRLVADFTVPNML